MLLALFDVQTCNKHYDETSEQVMSVFPAVMFSKLMKLMTRGVRIGLVSFHNPMQKQGCFDCHRQKSYFRDGIMRNVVWADLLKSESSTASNMHGRGNQALSCSNLFPLINSRRSTGCHPLGWALAPHTTRPRSHGYGSLWGPSSNLSSVTPGACRSHRSQAFPLQQLSQGPALAQLSVIYWITSFKNILLNL